MHLAFFAYKALVEFTPQELYSQLCVAQSTPANIQDKSYLLLERWMPLGHRDRRVLFAAVAARP
jgi:hypothetical protein